MRPAECLHARGKRDGFWRPFTPINRELKTVPGTGIKELTGKCNLALGIERRDGDITQLRRRVLDQDRRQPRGCDDPALGQQVHQDAARRIAVGVRVLEFHWCGEPLPGSVTPLDNETLNGGQWIAAGIEHRAKLDLDRAPLLDAGRAEHLDSRPNVEHLDRPPGDAGIEAVFVFKINADLVLRRPTGIDVRD